MRRVGERHSDEPGRTTIFQAVLRDAPGWLRGLKDGRRIVRQGRAFGDLGDDTELHADQALGERLYAEFCRPPYRAGAISVEGSRKPASLGNGCPRWFCVDPLDGSLNYQLSGHLDPGSMLPHASCVTMLLRREAATFSDVTEAGIVDLRSGDIWEATCAELAETLGRQKRFVYTMRFNGRALDARRHDGLRLDLGSQLVLGETYYGEHRERLARAFAGKNGNLRSFGSAAYEMALVASGIAVAFISGCQKQHELGAGYLLVTGAGGVAIDWDGNDLGPQAYAFDAQTPCILAVNRPIAEEILERLRKAS